MTTNDEPLALRDELRSVDEELAQLRRGMEQLRESADGPTDSAEIAATVTAAEEQDALIATLEARRADLLRQLGEG
jgi:hypothetical protein